MIAARLAVWGLALASAGAVSAAHNSNEIAGRVIDAQSGEGIARARVELTIQLPRPDGKPFAESVNILNILLLTNADGTFGARNIPNSLVSLWAEGVGYLGDPFGPPTPDSKAQIDLLDSQAPTTVTLRLTRQAVIEGRAVGPNGGGVAAVTL